MTQLKISSPNEKLVVRFVLDEGKHHSGALAYEADYDGAALLKRSRLGLQLEGQPPLQKGFEIIEHHAEQVDQQWQPVYGERETVFDRYSALHVRLQEVRPPHRQLELEFRAYDEGMAFRYKLPVQAGISPNDTIIIAAEHSEFHFPEGCYGYAEQGAEGEYHRVPLAMLGKDCERPLTIEIPGGQYAAVLEAGVDNYSRMLLSGDESRPGVIQGNLSGLITEYVGYGNMNEQLSGEMADAKIRTTLPIVSPWRVVMAGNSAGELLENNDIVLNLNQSCQTKDTSWIIPGKLLRDVTISNEGSRACVDFAAKYKFQYIMLDWGWYGDPFDDASICSREKNEIWIWNAKPEDTFPILDIRELIDYAESKGIGVFLYLDRRAVEQQLEQFLPIYKEWGVKGIKIGFVNTGPQIWTKWLHDVVRKCAEYGILVNVHDAYRPTGFSRTYPNLLTQEGIRGNEHMPTARHNATLPFTRFLAGAGDYTICYYTDRKQTTHAHQLAMSVIAYSPLQSMMWYDKPADYEGEPEMEFFAQLPTVWKATRVLLGEIGEYAVIARQHEEAWFVGAITNERQRELAISLDFLEEGKPYLAYIYSDSFFTDDDSRTKVNITIREVHSRTKLHALMAPSGGQAIRIVPKKRM